MLEFDRLLEKHSLETGLPVVVDFYSDSCGPCRMMAPIFKKVAEEFQNKAVFVKVDTNAQYELSSRYQIRSLPTFSFFVGGKKVNQAVGGIGEQGLRQSTNEVVRTADLENVVLSLASLKEFYQQVDPTKSDADIQAVHEKCSAMNKGVGECVGAAAVQLRRRLKQKYKQQPSVVPRFTAEDRQSKAKEETTTKPKESKPTKGGAIDWQSASDEDLLAELERRADARRESEVEAEGEDEDEADPDFHRWQPSEWPERMIIIGGGPAGLAAAVYGARAGLAPLVIAPSMGGQLQGKGVDVENYPGLANVTGPAVIAAMRRQAAHFGAVFEDDTVVGIDASSRPLQVLTNNTGPIATHTVIVATGAEANWLGVEGEWELRGGGVSSCAVCDGFLYAGKDVIVVGGGDAAMEDALVLARTSKSVTLVHRRGAFRASKVLADRVVQHPSIKVLWNKVIKEIVGEAVETEGDEQDLDNLQKVVTGAVLQDTQTGETMRVAIDAVFVAIGHTPATAFLKNVVEFDEQHPGYLRTVPGSTSTSVVGIFAAGDVADAVYRQAITSAGSGAAAALDAERYLSEHGLGNEAAEFEAELLAELAADGDVKAAYNAYEEAGGRMEGMKESVASEL